MKTIYNTYYKYKRIRMEKCSYFVKDRALFGSFPTQEDVNKLELAGVRVFVDLTVPNEGNTSIYKTQYKYINYPIEDRKTPRDWKSFAQLIISLSDYIRNHKHGKLYIHCRGGHGRSGLLVACIISHLHDKHPDNAMEDTKEYHSQRPCLKEKWKSMGSPHGKAQQGFVRKFFQDVYYNYPQQYFTYTNGLCNTSEHPVMLEGLGVFPNAFLALQSFRDVENKVYIETLKKGIFDKSLVTKSKIWDTNKEYFLYIVLESKFRQHPDIKGHLLNTGLRKFKQTCRDHYWGIGCLRNGINVHGSILYGLREKFLREEMDEQFII